MSFIFLRALYSQEDTSEVVFYGGKRIFYYPDKELVILLDSSFVRYSIYEVKACSISYDLKNQILHAYKKNYEVIFSAEKDTIIGEELHFNINNKKGMMKKARTKIGDGFFYADEIWLIKEKVLHAINCSYTTCEYNPSHYHFFAKKVKILVEDMVIVEPISLHFFSLKPPFVAAPFWFFPIGEKRKSGLLPFRAGRSKEEGFYFKRVAYYLVINEHADLTFYLDLMQKKGIMPKIEGIYDYSPLAKGQFIGSFISESRTKRRRYSLNLQHTSKFLFKSELSSKIDYQSDAKFIQEYAEDKIEWLRSEIYSVANIKRTYRNFGQANLYLENKKDFINNINQFLLPSFSFSLVSRPLIRNFTNFSPSFRLENYYAIFKDTIKNYEERLQGNLGIFLTPNFLRNLRFGNFSYKKGKKVIKGEVKEEYSKLSTDANFGLSQLFLNTLYISENFGYSQEWNFYKDSMKTIVRYPISLNSGITLYRIYFLNLFSLKGFLHTLSPNINLNYEPATKRNLPNFKEKPKSLFLEFNILNNFNIKYLRKNEEKKRDFLILTIKCNYSFLEREFSPINMNGEIKVFEEEKIKFNSSFYLSYNFKEKIFEPSLTNNLEWKDEIFKVCTLNIKLSHIISKTSHMIQNSGYLNFSKIKFNFSFGYNGKEKKITDYSISIWRDLHCWEGIFNFSKFGTLWRYDFKLRIKKIPEVSIGKDIFGFLLK
uniref:LPS-assembly protein LptD n=1 Tax=candidate division WOR-3 bacterium TaxID=2052148 RepID=A0A7V4FED4_UNCW3